VESASEVKDGVRLGWSRGLSSSLASRSQPTFADLARDESVLNARLCHPSLRVNRVLRVMLHTRWRAEAWAEVRVAFRRALALRSELRRAGWFN
jgi:hypothetical protein